MTSRPLKYLVFLLSLLLMAAFGAAIQGGASTEAPQAPGPIGIEGTVNAHVVTVGSKVTTAKSYSGKYAYGFKDSKNRPARWNGCKAIVWRYNPAHQKAGGLADAKFAIAKLAKVNGIKYIYKGTTKVKVGATYPKGTSLVVGWGKAGDPLFKKYSPKVPKGAYVEGLGLAWIKWRVMSDGTTTTPEIVKGGLLLNYKTPANRTARQLAFMHEGGHVMGLTHVNSSRELMYPTIQPKDKRAWGVGDTKGLKKLGKSAGCFQYPIR